MKPRLMMMMMMMMMIATNVVTTTLYNHLDPPVAIDASTSHGTTLFKRVFPMVTTHVSRLNAPHHGGEKQSGCM